MTVLNIITAALLAVAVALFIAGHQFIRSRVITEGRVTELIAKRGSKGSRTYSVVATFRDAAGTPRTYRASFSSSNPGYAVGDPIRICYRGGSPEDCGVYSFGYRFGAAWIIGSIALMLVLISLGFRHGQRVMDGVYSAGTSAPDVRSF